MNLPIGTMPALGFHAFLAVAKRSQGARHLRAQDALFLASLQVSEEIHRHVNVFSERDGRGQRGTRHQPHNPGNNQRSVGTRWVRSASYDTSVLLLPKFVVYLT